MPVSGTRELSRGTLTFVFGLVFAIFIRVFLITQGDFPLHDGGMFYVMIRDLQASHYALPQFTSYNGLHIPFAYPPLGFYAAGLLADVTGANILEVLRILPLVLNIAAIGAFALLAKSILRSGAAAAAAVLVFSFLPHSMLWQIMGGGLTRGFGLLFALLAMHQGYELFAQRAYRRIVPTALFSSLTVLSHPKMAWFLAYSLALFVFWYGRDRRGLLAAFVVGSATVALTSPWWGTVIAYHGTAPFLASIQPNSTSRTELVAGMLKLDFTGERLIPILGILAAIGIYHSIRSRQWMPLVWLALVVPLDSREYLTDALVPVALLAGLGLVEVVQPWLTQSLRSLNRNRERWIRPIITSFAIGYIAISSSAATFGMDSPLSVDERSAMAWVAGNTPVNSRFVVVSGDEWWGDRSSEWFPALTGRESVANVQGTEWLSDPSFSQRIAEYDDLQSCVNQSASCLETWEARNGQTFQYVYVTRREPIGGAEQSSWASQHLAIEDALQRDEHYMLVYSNSGVAIYKSVVEPVATARLLWSGQ